MTLEIEAFQRTHTDHLGKGLRVDGLRGPRTEWAEDFATLCQARREIIAAAQLYLGLAEEPPGSNSERTGTIKTWLERANARPGDPWCAAFASWCVSQGVARAVRVSGAIQLGRRFPATTQPVAGDVFWYSTGGGRGHVGLVTGASASEVMTIEGNCGNAVRCVLRARSVLQFGRVVEDTSGTPPGIVPGTPYPPTGTR